MTASIVHKVKLATELWPQPLLSVPMVTIAKPERLMYLRDPLNRVMLFQ